MVTMKLIVMIMYEMTISRAQRTKASNGPRFVKNADVLAPPSSAPAISRPCAKPSPGERATTPEAFCPMAVKLSRIAGIQEFPKSSRAWNAPG
jgi:hypothetical protein